ncbi:D-glucuronyl C5-epimerase B [Tribolium castaneum]|uniref:heparosan-N-sulfate-glucuronate 5-epimerase n=1 Tax=Tribolium castaneum TaxID=7070 RepID=D6WZ61_TRICA|nr:PREDICTED: D-glucuronyl C5-epimerase [Tribolium castaneum]EFA10381.1 D-glucuronyl C5-epimerase-like Protein [Tribolium castaneum]|eukprot:XP_015839037.1 PREDICTED: D-glucuronyl C5-epimerase [Tribolium castaneum]
MSSLPKPIGSGASQKFFHVTKDPPLFFIMMRLNVKVALLFLTTIGFFTVLILWSVCGKEPNNLQDWRRTGKFSLDRLAELQSAEEIDCDINGEYVIGCRKEGDEVYLPFSFLHKYFEVYGKLATYDGLERFEWSHSYSRVYHPKGKYDPRGVFMYFENYNVEVRDRVKCVSAVEGVPISTQWESQGYYYPTQIAQFGLSHYSKNLTEPEPRRKIIEDGERELAKWGVPHPGTIERVYDKTAGSKVLKFKTGELYLDAIKLKMEHVLDFIMSLNIVLSGNSSFSIVLQNRETREIYNLHYITSDVLITVQDNNVYHGLGMNQEWKKLTRDLIVDLQKGLNYLDKDKSKRKIPKSKLKIITILLRGYGAIDNLTLSSSEHIQQFYDAAEWFVRHQDTETGGWPIPVKRKLASGFHDLQSGWYSAMGQGHAISVLSRAYHHSGGDVRYLQAALAGLKPFQVPSTKGGVLATFLNKYHWYEEYPTKPASFVLNGFIYSLLGLYDLMTIAPPGQADEAEFLFREGMISLKGMLLFYDMGSVTSYDLRHVTLGVAPNLARWDYHATHINQLLLLSTIENEPLFAQTAERWIGYMAGKRAAHN